jgi:hypothetical protein
MLHEVVVHRGAEAILENRLNPFMQEVAALYSNKRRAEHS